MIPKEVTLPIRCSTYKKWRDDIVWIAIGAVFVIGILEARISYPYNQAINDLLWSNWVIGIPCIAVLSMTMMFSTLVVVGLIAYVFCLGLSKLADCIPTFKCIPDDDDKRGGA